MHAKVALGIKVTIREESSLGPPGESLSLFVVEESDNALFVEDVSLFANKGILHFVDGLLKELLVLSDQQLLY